MRVLQGIIDRSVFKRKPRGASMESLLAVYFHRASATLYLGYTLWAVISILNGIPSLVTANGQSWQIYFSISILICAAPACFGATFWPSFARLELFAGSGFVGLILLYVAFLVHAAIFKDGPWAGVTLVSTILIVTGCRVGIIIIFLLRQAEGRTAQIRRIMASLEPDIEVE